MRAAQTLKSEGSFAGLASLVPYADVSGTLCRGSPWRTTPSGQRRADGALARRAPSDGDLADAAPFAAFDDERRNGRRLGYMDGAAAADVGNVMQSARWRFACCSKS